MGVFRGFVSLFSVLVGFVGLWCWCGVRLRAGPLRCWFRPAFFLPPLLSSFARRRRCGVRVRLAGRLGFRVLSWPWRCGVGFRGRPLGSLAGPVRPGRVRRAAGFVGRGLVGRGRVLWPLRLWVRRRAFVGRWRVLVFPRWPWRVGLVLVRLGFSARGRGLGRRFCGCGPVWRGFSFSFSFSFWGCLVSVSLSSSVPSVRRASGSAVGSGAARWVVVPSARSLSGSVLVAGFASWSLASAFSRRWSGRLPRRCRGAVVRRRPSGLFAVSVPVAGVPCGR